MNRLTLVCVSFLVMLSACKRNTIPVPEDTALAARRDWFPYHRTLARAEGGNLEALRDLLRHSRYTDGGEALGHGQVLKDLIDMLGDVHFAKAVGLLSTEKERIHVFAVLEAGVAYDIPPGDPEAIPKLYPLTYHALTANREMPP